MRRDFARMTLGVAIAAAALAGGVSSVLAQEPPAPVDAAAFNPHASSITLHVKDAPLATVAAQLAKESGNAITVAPNQNGDAEPPTVTIDADAQPFFVVLDKIADQAGCNLNPSGEGKGGLVLTPNGNPQPSTPALRADAGPILLTPDKLDRLKVLTADASAGDYAELEINAVPEPRLDVLYYSTASLAQDAVDENGTSLAPPAGTSLDDPRLNGDRPPEGGDHIEALQPNESQQLTHHLLLRIPDTAGRRIKHLSGTFSAWVCSQTQIVELTNLGGSMRKPVTTKLSNGLTLAVGSENTGGGPMGVGLIRSGGSDRQWEADQRAFQNAKIELVAQDGTITSSSSGSASWSDREHWTWVGADRNNLKKIIVSFPVGVTQIDVPFAFDDLPMP